MKSQKRLVLEMLVILVLVFGGVVALQSQTIRGLFARSASSAISGAPVSETTKPTAVEGKAQEAKASLGPSHLESRPVASAPYPGFTLYATSGTAEVVLVNLQEKFIHRWDVDADRARLEPNCNLLAIHGSKWGLEREPWATLRSVVREYNWDGEVVWEQQLPGDAHHDVTTLTNGHRLILYLTRVPEEQIVQQLGPEYRNVHIRTDVLIEVDESGEIVWEWAAHKNLSLKDCGARKCPDLLEPSLRDGKKRFDWTHINTVREIPENHWYDEGDTRFKPGNIIIFPRNFWSSLIIDKDTKKEVWRYHGEFKGGISGGHESYMIPPGIPGEGNILIFDNGRVHESSHVLEVDPVSKKVVWTYENGKRFFSRVAGAAQRLPNGNTLISEDTTGRVFEVNSTGNIVWSHQAYKNRINRAHRYDVGFCPKLTEELL